MFSLFQISLYSSASTSPSVFIFSFLVNSIRALRSEASVLRSSLDKAGVVNSTNLILPLGSLTTATYLPYFNKPSTPDLLYLAASISFSVDSKISESISVIGEPSMLVIDPLMYLFSLSIT